MDFFLLAMAHQQLKDPAQARGWYAKGVQWMEKKDPGNLGLVRLRIEAERALGLGPSREIIPSPRPSTGV